LAGVAYAVGVIQGNMVYEDYGSGQSVQWTPLEAGAFWSVGALSALGVVLVALGWIVGKRQNR
jgi:hypothetical protein